MNRIFSMIIAIVALSITAIAQTPNAAKISQAKQMIEDGQIASAINILKNLVTAYPDDYSAKRELAEAHYIRGEYKTAAKYLSSLSKDQNADASLYRLLGNCYDMMGKPGKAVSSYKKGLTLFPYDGSLYNEMGAMEMVARDYNSALDYYETGIKVDPKFSANYLRAANILFASPEPVWGMIYGEIFRLLEPASEQSIYISAMLYEMYLEHIKYANNECISINFSDSSANNNGFSDFGSTYKTLLAEGVKDNTDISLETLDDIRSKFIDAYFADAEKTRKYPNILFDYQKKVKDAGHMKAYNYWILGYGENTTFDKWVKENPEKWDAFEKWKAENKFSVDSQHHFYRLQY